MKQTINLRQKRFIELYIALGNATEAYTQSGYRAKHADRAAHILLQKHYIKAELEKFREKVDISTQLTYEFKLKVLHEGINHYTATGDYDKAAKLISVANSMQQGHLAPVKSVSNITVTNELSMLKELTEEYLKGDYQSKQDHCH